MKTIKIIMTSSMFVAVLALVASFTEMQEVTLEAGTRVSLEALQTVNSKADTAGQLVTFLVKDNIKVKDKVVIRGGTIAAGEISKCQRAKAIGKQGLVEVELVCVQAVDSQLIYLVSNAPVHKEGKNQKKLSIGVTIGGCVFCGPLGFLGLLVKGKEGEIIKGTVVDATVANMANIKVE